MMTLSEEVLQQIKEMSSALLPPGEIAILLNIPVNQRDFFCDICKIIIVRLSILLITREDFRPSSTSGKQSSN